MPKIKFVGNSIVCLNCKEIVPIGKERTIEIQVANFAKKHTNCKSEKDLVKEYIGLTFVIDN